MQLRISASWLFGSSIRTGIYGSSIRTFSSFWGPKSRGKPMGSLLVNGGRNASLSLVGGAGFRQLATFDHNISGTVTSKGFWLCTLSKGSRLSYGLDGGLLLTQLLEVSLLTS